MTINEQFERAGANLRALRQAAGLSQQKLAADIDLNYMTVNRVELGRSASVESVDAMARQFGWRVEIVLVPLEREGEAEG